MSATILTDGLRERLSEIIEPPLSDSEWNQLVGIAFEPEEAKRELFHVFIKEHAILEREYRKSGKLEMLQRTLEASRRWPQESV